MLKKIAHFFTSQRGATSIEYALISSMIFLSIVLAVSNLGATVRTLFESVVSAFP
ncbi:MAG: Flp family type IVb pilin [Deltaproteobacteria bacterium]|nr:Flp family type IVb pilin [Deltaproteobacteria bacterium]